MLPPPRDKYRVFMVCVGHFRWKKRRKNKSDGTLLAPLRSLITGTRLPCREGGGGGRGGEGEDDTERRKTKPDDMTDVRT